MNGEQAKYFLFAQAEMARVAAMQAANAATPPDQKPPYSEEAFNNAAHRIDLMAIELANAS